MRYCLALDLKDDAKAIERYKKAHEKEQFRPEITESIKAAGIEDMHIYITGNRLFMIMEVRDDFDFKRKASMDAANPHVQDWENFVEQFQQRLPWAQEGEKWVLMEHIYALEKEN